MKNPKLMEQRKHFNSHPHEEDDRAGLQHLLPSDYFNSHPHEEDDEKGKTYKEEKSISTHILTKRMTEDSFETGLAVNYFNSHPHEEDDGKYNRYYNYSCYFNSHPHEEDDLNSIARTLEKQIFQLTSSRRG